MQNATVVDVIVIIHHSSIIHHSPWIVVSIVISIIHHPHLPSFIHHHSCHHHHRYGRHHASFTHHHTHIIIHHSFIIQHSSSIIAQTPTLSRTSLDRTATRGARPSPRRHRLVGRVPQISVEPGTGPGHRRRRRRLSTAPRGSEETRALSDGSFSKHHGHGARSERRWSGGVGAGL